MNVELRTVVARRRPATFKVTCSTFNVPMADPIDPADLDVLLTFRRLAADVREGLVRVRSGGGHVHMEAGYVESDDVLEAYKALCIPVRRAYRDSDRASFSKASTVLNDVAGMAAIARKHGASPPQRRLPGARAAPKRAAPRPRGRYPGPGGTGMSEAQQEPSMEDILASIRRLSLTSRKKAIMLIGLPGSSLTMLVDR